MVFLACVLGAFSSNILLTLFILKCVYRQAWLHRALGEASNMIRTAIKPYTNQYQFNKGNICTNKTTQQQTSTKIKSPVMTDQNYKQMGSLIQRRGHCRQFRPWQWLLQMCREAADLQTNGGVTSITQHWASALVGGAAGSGSSKYTTTQLEGIARQERGERGQNKMWGAPF